LVGLWFAALDSRRAEVLVGMCQPDVVVRPYRARQESGPAGFEGHEGIRTWVASLDAETRISLELREIEITGPESAIVEADVWFDRAGARSGGFTVSVWQFEDGRLREAVGYGTREDALTR
jgi:ketosteroid isomerase-like protein